MRIYLDNSVLNRPFDDQSIFKIRLETIGAFFIFELIERRKIRLVNSSVIEYENSKNPFFERKIWITSYLSKASYHQKINLRIKERAQDIQKLTIQAIDSLHLASAEAAGVDYFITCDYDVIKKYKGKLKVFNPVDFIRTIIKK